MDGFRKTIRLIRPQSNISDPTPDVEIHGGVGNATVRLPNGVGIVANARGGIGNVDAEGLEKHNGRWVSPQREDAKVTVHLDIHGGIGNITLRAN